MISKNELFKRYGHFEFFFWGGGPFKSQTSENRPPAVLYTKDVNLMSETTQIILVHTKQLPRQIWLDSEVFK